MPTGTPMPAADEAAARPAAAAEPVPIPLWVPAGHGCGSLEADSFSLETLFRLPFRVEVMVEWSTERPDGPPKFQSQRLVCDTYVDASRYRPEQVGRDAAAFGDVYVKAVILNGAGFPAPVTIPPKSRLKAALFIGPSPVDNSGNIPYAVPSGGAAAAAGRSRPARENKAKGRRESFVGMSVEDWFAAGTATADTAKADAAGAGGGGGASSGPAAVGASAAPGGSSGGSGALGAAGGTDDESVKLKLQPLAEAARQLGEPAVNPNRNWPLSAGCMRERVDAAGGGAGEVSAVAASPALRALPGADVDDVADEARARFDMFNAKDAFVKAIDAGMADAEWSVLASEDLALRDVAPDGEAAADDDDASRSRTGSVSAASRPVSKPTPGRPMTAIPARMDGRHAGGGASLPHAPTSPIAESAGVVSGGPDVLLAASARPATGALGQVAEDAGIGAARRTSRSSGAGSQRRNAMAVTAQERRVVCPPGSRTRWTFVSTVILAGSVRLECVEFSLMLLPRR
jgi:hypothetical protein